jgi:hypothetical protein
MWIFTSTGFYSIVQKQGDELLTIRSRVATDVVSLRDQYLPMLSPIIATPDADYAFRATATHRDVAEALASIAASIDYGNFKDVVASKQGEARAKVYADVWAILWRFQEMEKAAATDVSTRCLASPTMITSADLTAWKKQVKLLRVARMVFAAAAITSPCKCDACSHCRELAQVGVEIETVGVHTSERLAWLEDRVRFTAA